MTGIPARERIASTLPMKRGKIERHAFAYVRHGTPSPIAHCDGVTDETGGTIAGTRTEADFVAFLNALFASTASSLRKRSVGDHLDTHMSKGVARPVTHPGASIKPCSDGASS